jgi:cytidylate kinase
MGGNETRVKPIGLWIRMIYTVAIAGRIAAGKSSVSSELASRLGWKRASFGDFVRSVAAQRGLEPSREVLQKVGEELEAVDSAAFCKDVLTFASWNMGDPVVIDGIRHVRILEDLKKIVAPQRLLFVYLDAEDTTRKARFAHRESTNAEALAAAESHSTELDVISKLPDLADLRLSNDDGAEYDLVEIIVQRLRTDGR